MLSAIITGAGSGLGKELALQFSTKGYHIILLGRNEAKLQYVKDKIEAKGGLASHFQLDISDSIQITEVLTIVSKQFKPIILVNNAGIGHFGPFDAITETEITAMINTNILGSILMTKATLPLLLDQEQSHIIQVISTAGLRGKANEAVYCASKFALRGFTESLQKELAKTSTAVTAVYMGGMDTPFWEESHHVKDKSRFRHPKEVAQLIVEQYKNKNEIIIESKTTR
ncbi:SDR family oxidoreductase [Peribacillus saganii]|uniref:SDR family oxidoreductase n=1 Tax=Peribacillus saganii TaxID=2303992 RepID=A0A372LM35_9BACI|nr:SDR family oxidoreductase [Peribacillus saganii]RFU68154.1 SDR family oxidoreductase [Peribacillus saganii]